MKGTQESRQGRRQLKKTGKKKKKITNICIFFQQYSRTVSYYSRMFQEMYLLTMLSFYPTGTVSNLI